MKMGSEAEIQILHSAKGLKEMSSLELFKSDSTSIFPSSVSKPAHG
jgi:hypothetical protein